MPGNSCVSVGAAILVGIGIVLSFYSSFWCEYVNVDLPADGRGQGGTIHYGPWRHSDFVLLVDEDGDFWKIDTCDRLSSDWDIDAKWKVARAGTIIGPVLGALGAAFIFCKTDAAAGVLILAALFQGLVMLFLQSNACDREDPVLENLPAIINVDGLGDCELGGSGIMSIVAAGLFFLGAIVAAVGGRMAPSDNGIVQVGKTDGEEALEEEQDA